MERGSSSASGPGSKNVPQPGAPAVFVIDTSVLLAGRPIVVDGVLYATPDCVAEVQHRGRDRRMLEYLLEAGLRVISPKPASMIAVEEASVGSGDAHRLSDADMTALALAHELRATIMTDDYSMQNVAATLDIPFRPVNQQGIREVFTWQLRCVGCRKMFPGTVKECDVCGSPVKTVKTGSRPV